MALDPKTLPPSKTVSTGAEGAGTGAGVAQGPVGGVAPAGRAAGVLDLEAIKRSVAGMYVRPLWVPELVDEVARLRVAVAAERAKRVSLENLLVGVVVAQAMRGLRALTRGAA
jgi:hypothetical protein